MEAQAYVVPHKLLQRPGGKGGSGPWLNPPVLTEHASGVHSRRPRLGAQVTSLNLSFLTSEIGILTTS